MNKSMQRAIQIGLSSLVISCAACSQDAVEPAAPSQQAPAADQADTSIGDQLSNLVNNAVADVASQSGLAATDVTVVQASMVNWASGALGCPEGDRSYTQAIVPGILVILDADGMIYRYHGRQGQALFHCPNNRATAPALGPGEEFM
jgi:hypothetical protein